MIRHDSPALCRAPRYIGGEGVPIQTEKEEAKIKDATLRMRTIDVGEVQLSESIAVHQSEIIRVWGPNVLADASSVFCLVWNVLPIVGVRFGNLCICILYYVLDIKFRFESLQ